VGVVLLAPASGKYLGFQQDVKLLDRQQFVAHTAAIRTLQYTEVLIIVPCAF
jgi:hypothetical protein